MRAIRLFCVALLLAALPQASRGQALDPAVIRTLKYGAVNIIISAQGVREPLRVALKNGIQAQLARLPQGTRSVRADVEIKAVTVVDPPQRYGLAWFGKDSAMTVNVKLVDETGATVAEFLVTTSSNSGSFSGQLDEEQKLADAVARGVWDTLRGY